jgi:hypothetical protein
MGVHAFVGAAIALQCAALPCAVVGAPGLGIAYVISSFVCTVVAALLKHGRAG